MVQVISDKKQIDKCQSMFKKTVEKHFSEIINIKVGHQGNSWRTNVHYNRKLNLWYIDQKLDSRYWNGFGIGLPKTGERSNSIVVEVNVPLDKINRQVAAVFAVENGKILVLHRGNIGGGRKGIGKKLFLESFQGSRIEALDGNITTEFCLVGELTSEFFLDQLNYFIEESERIKLLPKQRLPKFRTANLRDFKNIQESYGISTRTAIEQGTVNRTHGLIVRELKSILHSRGFDVLSDIYRDLYIHDDNSIKVLFEIKTSNSTQSIYSAIGQLILYGMMEPYKQKLVMVLPEKLDKRIVLKLQQVNISVLFYRWFETKPVFENLETLIKPSFIN